MPGFWDDQKKAQVVTRRRAALEQQIGTIEKLTRDLDDAIVLLDLASENDESTIAEAAGQAPALEDASARRSWRACSRGQSITRTPS